MAFKNSKLRNDLIFRFGDKIDGAIGIPCITAEGQIVEASYFYAINKLKNIIVISSQINCPMKCYFCELGTEKFIRNLSRMEMVEQVRVVLTEAEKEGFTLNNYPHKITIANTGEPLFNPDIVSAIDDLGEFNTSFKISTVLPATTIAFERAREIAQFSYFSGRTVQLQISLISTLEEERQRIIGVRAASFREIRKVGEMWRSVNPTGRKVNLSLIITSTMDCDADKIADIFPPELFRFRFREYVSTENGTNNGLVAVSAEKLAEIKEDFRERGYEVTDFASPTPIERKFGLVSNAIRRMYLEMAKNK